MALVVALTRLIEGLASAVQRFQGGMWSRLTSPSSPDYHPAWAPLIIVDTLVIAAQLVVAFLLLYFFFKTRKAFPRVAIGFTVTGVVFLWLGVLVGSLLDLWPTTVQQDERVTITVIAVIGIVYLLRSRRVALTFVH